MLKHRKKSDSKHFQEFSKCVITTMVIIWFLVALLGIAVTIYQLLNAPEYVSIESLYNYIGLPMTGGIIGYLLKSAVENHQKVKTSVDNMTDETENDAKNREING